MRRFAPVIVVSATLLVALVLASVPASAHPPEELTLVFNDRLDILTVSIKHDVKDTSTHFIDLIEVYLNGALVLERRPTSQPKDSFNERFTLMAEPGDTIKVKACCNIEGSMEEELVVGEGITAAGDKAGMLELGIMVHAAVQVSALVLAIVAIPGGMGFYNAWRRKSKPKGRRRRHVRIGNLAVILWAMGSLGGFWIVYMTSGDYLGSPHGWLALGTFISAMFAGYSASPSFRKAGYGPRMHAHMPLALLTIVLGAIAVFTGLMTAGLV